jgi:hypothetical protein
MLDMGIPPGKMQNAECKMQNNDNLPVAAEE